MTRRLQWRAFETPKTEGLSNRNRKARASYDVTKKWKPPAGTA
jgi:hypothetical protein